MYIVYCIFVEVASLRRLYMSRLIIMRRGLWFLAKRPFIFSRSLAINGPYSRSFAFILTRRGWRRRFSVEVFSFSRSDQRPLFAFIRVNPCPSVFSINQTERSDSTSSRSDHSSFRAHWRSMALIRGHSRLFAVKGFSFLTRRTF